MAWLALSQGWRSAVAITGALVAGAFAAAAVLVPAGPPAPQGPHPSLLSGLGDAWRQRAIRLLLVAVFLGGVVTSVLFLYQVPTMVEAGLLLTTASALAGARGLFQLAGRLPLPWLVDRFGARLVLRLSLALIGSSSLLLLVSGRIIPAAAFIVLGGISVGAFTTLENIYATEVIDPSMFGTLLGLYSLVRGLGAALGPSGAGALTDLTSTRAWALVSIAVFAAVGGLLIPPRTSPS
jgi:predicted MFS family arabinose efflux permease